MSSFLALIGKHGPVTPDVLETIPDLAAAALPFRHLPYRGQRWRSASGQVALFGWGNDPAVGPEHPLIYERGGTAIAKGGYVAHPLIEAGFDLASIASAVAIDTETVSRFGGAFALLRVAGESDTVTVWNTATRLVSVFFAENDDLIVIGTVALLVGLVRVGRARPEYEPTHLVPFFSSGYFASEQTPYRGVDVLPANARLTASSAGGITEPIDDFDRECGTLVPTNDDYDEIAGRLVSAVGQFGGAPISCSLTGGKDSRLVVAALRAAGAHSRTHTRGFPDHPDVLIAKRVAEALGVEHTVSVPRTTARQGVRTVRVDLGARARVSLFATDGMLSAYETVEPAKSFLPWPIRMGGAGGESLRRGFAKGLPSPRDLTWKRARLWLYDRFLGQCHFFDPAAVVAYEAFLSAWIERQQDLGMRPVVALDTFYLSYRTGRWKAAARTGRHGARDWEPLTDNLSTKAGLRVHESVKLNDVLIYELLKRLSPPLVDIPFANKRWLFEQNGPRPGQEEAWHRRAPVTSPASSPSAFNWRSTVTTDLFEAFYDQIFNDPRASALFDVVDRERLQKTLLKQRGKPVSGSRIAFYWAIYTASVLLSNAWLDRKGESRPISINIPTSSGS